MLWWEPAWFPLDFCIYYKQEPLARLLVLKGGKVAYPFHLAEVSRLRRELESSGLTLACRFHLLLWRSPPTSPHCAADTPPLPQAPLPNSPSTEDLASLASLASPRKGKPAYLRFVEWRRSEFEQEPGAMSLSDFTKKVAAEWKAMSAEQRIAWEQRLASPAQSPRPIPSPGVTAAVPAVVPPTPPRR